MRPPPSSAEPPVTGICGSLLFSRSFPSPTMCICVYYFIGFFVVCVCFMLCRERRRRDGSRHRLIMERAKMDEISVLSLLSSYLRQKVSKEGQLSYPNFVWGLFFDGIQPLVDRFEVLGTLCCTIREVPRHAGNQKEALLRNP